MTRSETLLPMAADDADVGADDDADAGPTGDATTGPTGDTDAGPDSGVGRRTADGSPSPSAADRRDALRGLTEHGGELAVEETRRALRTLDDGPGVDPETRRVLTTMAVRLSMRLLRRPTVAVEASDDRTAETVAELFAPAE